MTDIADAGLRWADGKIWVVAGDPVLRPGECWASDLRADGCDGGCGLAATGGVPMAAVHEALLGLDRYAEFYAEPARATG
jgi:hypothetical protein